MAHISTLDTIVGHVRAQLPRLTKGKKAVLAVLFHADRAMTAQEIYAVLQAELQTTFSGDRTAARASIDLATVYRNLEQFEKINVVNRSEYSAAGWRYALAQRHHAHVVACVLCGREVEVGACAMTEVDKIIAERTGFANIHHIVNFTGSCPACQHSSDTAA